jgi:hypothetical protein
MTEVPQLLHPETAALEWLFPQEKAKFRNAKRALECGAALGTDRRGCADPLIG